jgi:hypothetical protein
MASKPFSRQAGSKHFQELKNEHLSSFNQSSFFIEVGPEIGLDDLSDQMLWGPQPRLKRGDFVTIMRSDNAFFVTMLCESSSAGYPTMKIMTLLEREAAATAEPSVLGGDGVEFIPNLPGGTGHMVAFGGEIIGVTGSQEEADALLAAHKGEAA